MRKIFLICFISLSSIFSQSNFWEHYRLNIPVRQLVETPDGLIYAITDSTILKSTDYGNEWTTIYEAPSPISINNFRLEINTNSFNSNTFIVRRSGWNSFDPQISTNGGASWQNLTFPGSYFRDVSISSNGDIYLLSDTLYKSTDNGANWNPINTPTEYWMGANLVIDENDNIFLNRGKRFWLYDPNGFPIYTWWEDKIYRSSDYGQNWQYLFYLWDEDQIIQMYTIPQNNVLFDYSYRDATHHFGNGYDRDFPLMKVNWAVFENNIIKYTSSSTQAISFSSNNGQTWSGENSGLPNLHTYSLLRDSLGYLYTGTDNGIFKSNFTSYSLSSQSDYQFADTKIGDTTLQQITITNPFTFYLSLDSIQSSTSNFFISEFNNINLPPSGSTSIEIGFVPDSTGPFNDYATVFAGDVVGRFRLSGFSPQPTLLVLPFTNFGSVTVGDTAISELKLTSQSVNDILIVSLYMAINEQFFVEPMIFPKNIKYNDTLVINIYFAPTVQSLIFKKDTVVIHSNSVNSEVLQVVTGRGVNPTAIEYQGSIITNFSLSNNFPNPFNPSTTIEYNVPKRSNVKISIFNLIGEEVLVLVNEEKDYGEYQIEFTVNNLPSGVYFYKMHAENFVATKKFVLLK